MKTILWEELRRSDDPMTRSFLIRQITLCGETKNLDELSELAVSQIITPKLPEDQRSQLRYSLIEMAEPAAQAVLNRIEEETGTQRTQLVSLLDVLCTEGEVSPETLNKATRSLLNLLAAAERNTRRRVLEAAFLADDRVDVELKQEVANELLSHMSEFRLRSTRDTICYSLEQIGIPAIEPILAYIERRYPHEETDEAFHTLGRIAKKFGDDIPQPLAADALEYCLSLFDKPYTKRGAFIIALAWLAGYTSAGKQRFDRVIKELRDRLWKSKYSFDILEALGVIAGSRNVLKEHQRDLFELFATIVNKQSPEVLGRRRETPEGTVYEFGAEVMFDTRVIPAVVKGLERLGVSEITPNEIRTEIVKKLLILWEGVSNVRVVWGPASVESLVSAMSSMACCRMLTSDLRARLGRALLKFLNKVSVVEGLGHVCSMDDKNQDMRKLCLQTANAMLSEWEHCDQEDQERRICLLNSMSRIAANTALEPHNEDVRKMRENVVEALFQGLRSGIREVIEPLKRLHECPDIPEEQRKLIENRLANASGLIHVR
jgi:hypothetical protein